MKKTKWTKDDFRVGDKITITTSGGSRFNYEITKVKDSRFDVKEGGDISYSQITTCGYDIKFNNRNVNLNTLKIYKIKEHK